MKNMRFDAKKMMICFWVACFAASTLVFASPCHYCTNNNGVLGDFCSRSSESETPSCSECTPKPAQKGCNCNLSCPKSPLSQTVVPTQPNDCGQSLSLGKANIDLSFVLPVLNRFALSPFQSPPKPHYNASMQARLCCLLC